ncbi:MAG TPA: hypothetical protein VK803_08520 [Steroidobacteraceae bacterium]|nr:hypothetical protein [Steroidobacteraceae bacterium]
MAAVRAVCLMSACRSLAGLLLATAAVVALADTDDTALPAGAPPGPLALTLSQQQAVGIRIEHPLPLSAVPQIEAYGTVLDPLTLVSDIGRVESTRAAAAAASADATRLERLYREEAQASLKAWQAAQAQSAEAAAQARAAELGFRLQWGPLAAWKPAEREALLAALADGRQLLLRADAPAHASGSALDRRALIEVEGVEVSARVLGALPRVDVQTQTSGWLLQLERAPPGLGPGARVRVRLQTTAAAGLLVPAAALLYAAEGAYVYRRVSGTGADRFSYAVAPVRPVARVGDAWLVEGLAREDQVVVQGAGVLWSLQGISSFSAAEEEHD